MQAENNSTSRLSDRIPGPPLLRFQTDMRNFHAFLSAIGHVFDRTTELRGTSEVGLALLFILLGEGEVILLDEGPTYYC
jgi:hypothetical protein